MHKTPVTILIIEDDPTVRKVLTIALESTNYKVVSCDSGEAGKRLTLSERPQLLLLDLSLPDIDGNDVISAVRQWSLVPIIVCSAHHADGTIIKALETGADDYITKPFNPGVVLARIAANLRKATVAEAAETEITNGCIRMDLGRHEVYVNEEKVLLTPKEYEVLRYFLFHQDKMLTHKDILRSVWGRDHVEDLQYLRVYMRQLREKIEPDPSSPRYIITEPGIGYRMEAMGSPVLDLMRHVQAQPA